MRLHSYSLVMRFLGLLCLVLNLTLADLQAAVTGELSVGSASISITPDQAVQLSGQMSTRISRGVETPLIATALALETRDGDKVVEQAIFVSCDLLVITPEVYYGVQKKLEGRLQGFDLSKLILNATHTHTAPVTREGLYLMAEGVMSPTQFLEFLTERLANVVEAAWNKRQPGEAGWGLGHAVVAYNRRAVYQDGSTRMYGRTDLPEFRGIEGPEDQGVEILFFWDRNGQLICTAINVAVPSQVVEQRSFINADFWHQVRALLQKKYGEGLHVLAWTGAAGDQSPRPMFRKVAEERMRNLKGVDQLEELAGRIADAWEETYAAAQKEQHANLVFKHVVKTVPLPALKISESDYQSAVDGLTAAQSLSDPGWRNAWHQSVVERYKQQQKGDLKPYDMQLHAVRLGDIAIANNDFEYYTEFGIQIKARSKALQTFVIQLSGPGGSVPAPGEKLTPEHVNYHWRLHGGSYVPTQRAVQGGSYSAAIQSNEVGPEGGQELVERTVELINSLWD